MQGSIEQQHEAPPPPPPPLAAYRLHLPLLVERDEAYAAAEGEEDAIAALHMPGQATPGGPRLKQITTCKRTEVGPRLSRGCSRLGTAALANCRQSPSRHQVSSQPDHITGAAAKALAEAAAAAAAVLSRHCLASVPS